MKERRQQRVEQWSNFMDDMCVKSSAVDQEHDNEVRRVDNYYRDLEAKLRLSRPQSPS